MALDIPALTKAIRAPRHRSDPRPPGRLASDFAPHHENEPYKDIVLTRDHRYGGHERHRLDVFQPKAAGLLPVFVFVHGGGFVRGDKKNPGTPYNDNVPLWAARHGMVGVNIVPTATRRKSAGRRVRATWPTKRPGLGPRQHRRARGRSQPHRPRRHLGRRRARGVLRRREAVPRGRRPRPFGADLLFRHLRFRQGRPQPDAAGLPRRRRKGLGQGLVGEGRGRERRTPDGGRGRVRIRSTSRSRPRTWWPPTRSGTAIGRGWRRRQGTTT